MKYNASLGRTLSILYAEENPGNNENKTIFSLTAKVLQSSFKPTDIVALYQRFKELNKYHFDVVIIDNTFSLDLYLTLRSINPKQKIIINVKEKTSDNLSKFHQYGIENCLYEPLDIKKVNETILKEISSSCSSEFLYRNMAEYEKLDKNSSEIIRQYETKFLEMEQKLKNQADFFASMSHEIRTPLNSIIGVNNILIDDGNLKKKELEKVQVISKSSNMLLGILNDILDFSKIEAGMLEIEKIPFEINSVLDNLADMLSLKAQEKGIDLVFDIENSVRKNFLGDPLRLSQILLNLLGNAVKFTQKGTVLLRITSVDNGLYTQFEVRDTGIGIQKEQLKNLFKNYTQASGDTTRKYGGTGLGLSISKQLTELMNGTIWAQSVYEKGTSFFVKVKLEEDTQATKRRYRLPSKELMNKKVLAVDSRHLSLKSLKHMLEYFHFDVITVASAKEARNNLFHQDFDMLFIDHEIFESCKVEMLNIKSLLHIVIMKDWMESIEKENTNEYTFLTRPYNQQILYETILDVYSYDSCKDSLATKIYTKEDIKKLGKHKILLAEDNIINQTMMKLIFEDTDIEIVCVNDGVELIEELHTREYAYKLVLMDINMPKLNGYETAKKIRATSVYDDVSIVALSADVGKENIKKSQESGMQDYLTKPIDTRGLFRVLVNYLS